MDDSKFWKDLAKEFRELPKDNTYAYRVIDGLPGTMPPPISRWMLHSKSAHVAMQFALLARRGGDKLSPNDFVDSFQAWMSSLHAYGVNVGIDKFKHRFPASGAADVVIQVKERISDLSEASALLCGTLAIRAFEAARLERSQTPPAKSLSPESIRSSTFDHPTVTPEETMAEQIERLRQECRWTIEELAEKLGVHVRTVQRHLANKSKPYGRNLAAYERVFSKRLNLKIVIGKMP